MTIVSDVVAHEQSRRLKSTRLGHPQPIAQTQARRGGAGSIPNTSLSQGPIETGITATEMQASAPGDPRDIQTVAASRPTTINRNGLAVAARDTSDEETARFMARVVPWPEDTDALGYVNLHWTFWDGDEPPPNPPWAGIPTKSVQEFMKALAWVRAQKNTRDIYFCLSLQSQTRRNKRGRIVAARSKQNAIAMKAVWLDIDVKEGPKGYATLAEALAAVSAFCKSIELPPPSAVVLSGGGLHVYWISDRPLTPEEWRLYAGGLKAAAEKFGLKCDAGCTTDAARVLRVPGTFNYKKKPRRPVSVEMGDE
jgi:hypothetical protein